MEREQRWELRYVVVSAEGKEIEKVCYPRSEEQKQKNLDVCKRMGYKVLSVKKMYPINMERNQHNFMLVMNICSNRMHDMRMGNIEWNAAEYDRLEEIRKDAEEFFGLYGVWNSHISWLTGERWQRAKEICNWASEHRANACIEAGRPDLVAYC